MYGYTILKVLPACPVKLKQIVVCALIYLLVYAISHQVQTRMVVKFFFLNTGTVIPNLEMLTKSDLRMQTDYNSFLLRDMCIPSWWSECIPKWSSLILFHLSLFFLANTMPLVPRRIIGLHCRRQTIYWHFASLNSTVSLPGAIHFKQYML